MDRFGVDPIASSAVLDRFQVIHDVPLTLQAELDRQTISFRELMALGAGSLVTLSRATGENIDLYAGDVLIGSGEILVVDGTLAVRIADLRDAPVNGPDEAFLESDNPPTLVVAKS